MSSATNLDFRKYPKGVMVEALARYPLLLFDIPPNMGLVPLYESLNKLGPISKVNLAYKDVSSNENLGYGIIKMGDLDFYKKLASQKILVIDFYGKAIELRVEEQFSEVDLEVSDQKLSRRILRLFHLPQNVTEDSLRPLLGEYEYTIRFLEQFKSQKFKLALVIFETVKACRDCKSFLQSNPEFPFKFQIESEYLRSVQQQSLKRFEKYAEKKTQKTVTSAFQLDKEKDPKSGISQGSPWSLEPGGQVPQGKTSREPELVSKKDPLEESKSKAAKTSSNNNPRQFRNKMTSQGQPKKHGFINDQISIHQINQLIQQQLWQAGYLNHIHPPFQVHPITASLFHASYNRPQGWQGDPYHSEQPPRNNGLAKSHGKNQPWGSEQNLIDNRGGKRSVENQNFGNRLQEEVLDRDSSTEKSDSPQVVTSNTLQVQQVPIRSSKSIPGFEPETFKDFLLNFQSVSKKIQVRHSGRFLADGYHRNIQLRVSRSRYNQRK